LGFHRPTLRCHQALSLLPTAGQLARQDNAGQLNPNAIGESQLCRCRFKDDGV
jgi:hypothetical protein